MVQDGTRWYKMVQDGEGIEGKNEKMRCIGGGGGEMSGVEEGKMRKDEEMGKREKGEHRKRKRGREGENVGKGEEETGGGGSMNTWRRKRVYF